LEPVINNNNNNNNNNKTELIFDSNTTIKQWLRNNSLSALNLTILNILKTTILQNNKPKRIKILKKKVSSKVWNDVSIDYNYKPSFYFIFLNLI
jgi:hypothetical protein